MFASEAEFHIVADKTLEAFSQALETADAEGDLDVELQSGILTITMMSGRQFIVNKHAPSKQIWLSSPLSGGLHFSYENNNWMLADGRKLKDILALEVRELTDVVVQFV